MMQALQIALFGRKEVKDEQEHEHTIYILDVIIVNSKFNDEIGESRQKSNQQSIQRKCESQIMPMKRNSVRRTRNSARKNKVGEKKKAAVTESRERKTDWWVSEPEREREENKKTAIRCG